MVRNSISKTKNQNFQTLSNVERKANPPLILIVENDNAQQRLLNSLLELYPVEILIAKTGEEAIDLAIINHPDLIILNTELPGLDGFEAVRLLRTIKTFDEIPIIFLSNQTERLFRKKAFEVGGNAFHLQPLDIERLDAILQKFLFHELRLINSVG